MPHAACSSSLLVRDPWSRAWASRRRKRSSGTGRHAWGQAGYVTMNVAGLRRGAPGSVIVDSKAETPHTLHAARLLYGNRDLSGSRQSSWRDVYGRRTASPMTRATATAMTRKERHFQVTNPPTDSLPVVKSVITSSSCGALTGDVDAQSSRECRGGSRKRVRGSPDINDRGGGPPSYATQGLHSSMQHAASWDDEFRGGSQTDFRNDRDHLDERGVPVESWKTTETATTSGPTAAQGNTNAMVYDDCAHSHRQGSRLPVLATLGAESDDGGASVDTVDTRPLHSRGNSKARRRKHTRGTGGDSTKRDRAVGRPTGRASSALDGGWSLSHSGQTERQRQQLAAAGKEAVITRMLQTFSAPSGSKTTRSDFVNMVGRDRGSILIREEIHRALADRNVYLRDEELTSLMAFFDVQGRGYVTIGDVRDSLEGLRQGQQADHKTARIQPPQLPDYAESNRLGSALLAPLVLFTSPESLDGSKKRRRPVTKGGGAQWCRWEAGMGYLDITEQEIGSLADFLMGVKDNGVAAKQRVRHQPSDDDHGSKRLVTDDAGINDGDSRSVDQAKPLRALSTVMTVLRSAAVRAGRNNLHGERSRGPGVAAIPSSAARVCRVLAALQKLWRENNRQRRRMVGASPTRRGPDEFSDEELGAAVRLFEIDGIGSIELEDVTTVFRKARAGKFARRRPIAAVIPTLASLGRYLEERAVTADEFVQEAASTTVSAPPHASGGHSGEMTFTTKNKQRSNGNKCRPATAAQMGALLNKEMKLTAQMQDLVLNCVADNGLVWGANLAWAVQRARIELGHGQIKRQEQQRVKSSGYTSEGSDIKGHAQESLIGSDSTTTTSPPRTRTAVGNNKEVAVPRLQQRRPRGKPGDSEGFDHFHAALVIRTFTAGGGALRNLTSDTAVSLWRALKRQEHGIHTSEVGRFASRGLRQLLRHLEVKPHQWFATLDAEGGGERRVKMSSIIAGVKRLIADAGVLKEGIPTVARSAEVKQVDPEFSNERGKNPDTGKGKGSAQLLAGVRDNQKWDKKEFSALVGHLDPCGEGSITLADFQEGLRDSQKGQVAYPDASQLAAAHRFEAVLRSVGCEEVCGLIQTLTKGGRGGGDLVEYIRRMGDCSLNTSRDATPQHNQAPRAPSSDQQELHRTSEHASALQERLTRPENADALKTIERIDELLTRQGKRLAVEFNQADANRPGGVNSAELEQVMGKLVRPCSLLRSERKQRQERQEAAAAAVQRAESSKEFLMQRMEALHRSKASNFLEAISRELRRRRLQIRDVFQAVDQGKSGSLDVDGLLENSYRALGLTLERGEAEALISMLDVNGDHAIQCEELEFAMRSYRRYMWERAQWTKKRPFHEEYPSLSCLFSTAQGSEGGVQQKLTAVGHNESANDTRQLVSREDVVAALGLLRGDSNAGRGGILPAKGANGRRQQMFVKAIRKIAHCCQDAGVMTRPAFHATLVRFDFWPAGKARRNADRMRTIDVWHWLRLLTVSPYSGGGGGGRGGDGGGGGGARGRAGAGVSPIHGRRPEEASGRNKKGDRFGDGGGGGATGDEMVGARLLSREETSLVIEALEYRSSLGENARTGTDGVFISVNTFWKIMTMHAPGVVDWEAQQRLDAIEAARLEEIRIRESAAALLIQCLARQRQAREKIRATRKSHAAAAEAKRLDAAAVVIQCAARKRQAKKALVTARLRHAAAEEERKEAAALTVQCALRQWKARKIRLEKEDICRQAAAEKASAAVVVQCAVRQWLARAHVREKAAEQVREEELRVHQIKSNAAATRIQAVQRGRLARQRAAEAEAARAAEAKAKAEFEEAARQLAAAIKAQNEARAAVQIQCAARQRRARKETAVRVQRRQDARDAAARALAVEESKRAAAVKIQSVVRGGLVRVAAERAAETAALDAAIAARRAQLSGQADGAPRGQTEWRKKSVVGARGAAGRAGLTVQAADRG